MRPTIQDVAALAGVSPMTVSNVLRGRAKMSTLTKERVLRAVQELDYVPVSVARQNSHIDTHIAGIVPYHLNVSRNAIDIETHEGICLEARRHGYDLLIMLRDETEWMSNYQELRFLGRRSDGFIFISTGINEWQDTLKSLARHRVPTVVCYRRDVPEGIAWVDADNENIMNLSLEHLMSQGHRRIAYLMAPSYDAYDENRAARYGFKHQSYDDVERRSHFTRIMRENGCDEYSMCFIESSPDWQLNSEVLKNITDCGATAVFCGSDSLALHLWEEAEKCGLKVPEQLSIIGVDNTLPAQQRGLTSVSFANKTGYVEIGQAAMESWVAIVKGGDYRENCKVVPVELVVRESVARSGVQV